MLSVLLGIAGFCAMPFIVGVNDLLQTIGRVGWLYLILFVVNASGTIVIPAIGWWLIMRAEGLPVSLGVTLQTNLMGYPLNVMTPSMFLGGEPLKTFYIAVRYRVTKRRVLATIIVAKLQELGGLILSMIVATALFIWQTDVLTIHVEVLLIALLVLLAGFFILTLYAFAGRKRPLVTLIKLLSRWRLLSPLLSRLLNLAEEIEERIHTTLTHRFRVLLLSQAITCLSAVTIFLRPWIFFRALPELPVGFEQLCALFVITNLVNALTIVPGGLGLFEGSMAGYASLVHLGDDKGMAFALICRIADLTFLVIGGILILLCGLEHFVRGRNGELTVSAGSTVSTSDTEGGADD
jgi:uncharacterized protein (TIRG00374 family)